LFARHKRLAVLLAAGAVLIACGAAYYEFFWARPMGEGPAGPPVDPAPFADVWTERPVEFVGLGDSITAGLGASTPELRVQPHLSEPGRRLARVAGYFALGRAS